MDKEQKGLVEFVKKNIRSILKIGIPVIVCIAIVVVAVKLINSKTKKDVDDTIAMVENQSEGVTIDESALKDEPLETDAYSDVKALMDSFYIALADGDIDTVQSLKDATDDTELVTYEKKSEYIESYNNMICYTKKGVEPDSYFVYEYYEVKFINIDTMAPGLNTWYVYKNEEGNLQIDGDMDESINAYPKLVTSQSDVVDLFNKVDVAYADAIQSDETLNAFLAALPEELKTSVGEALAEAEKTTDDSEENAEEEAEETESEDEIPTDQTVNQIVKATDTINVRKSDSEEADKLGKLAQGTEVTRVEDKANGWSRIIFEDQEAYVKSDYLEVVSENEEVADNQDDDTEQDASSVNAGASVTAQTNVNVRNQPGETSDKIGTATAGTSYTVKETLNDGWIAIDYKGQTGYAKAEFFR